MRGLIWCVMLGAALSGCARIQESRFNPLNVFSPPPPLPVEGRNALLPEGPQLEALDPRGAIEQITRVALEPVPGGAILRATGVAEVQGAYDAELVLIGQDGATRVYQFRVDRPVETQVGSALSRQITVAARLTNQELASVGAIRVEGRRNAATVGR
ncbi:hypothetical protein AAD018_007080 [Aestuariibius insulae]|uniref:hypothetical protein n=1 Tax=Aestuariibius insulae TaxID=2058287 RepID=UPI00345E898A